MAQVKFGIIGCGNIGPIHAEAISKVKNAKLVAVSDVVEKNARALAEKYGADAYTDYRALLDRKDVQVVNLCVPSGMRLEMGKVCAAAGKHIISEKPVEITAKRIDQLIAATDKAGVRLGCIFQSRFADGTIQIQKALTQGRFGRLVLGDAYIKWYRSAEYYKRDAWRGTRRLDGGGALMNQGIHQIDLLLAFMGPVKWVQGYTRLIGHEGLEVEDLACATIEFVNGAFGCIEGSTAIWPGHPARVEVHGTDGSAILEEGQLRSWDFKKETRADARLRASFKLKTDFSSGATDPLSQLKSEGHRRNIDDFVRAILEDRPHKLDGREGRRAVALIEAIYKSASKGKRVHL